MDYLNYEIDADLFLASKSLLTPKSPLNKAVTASQRDYEDFMKYQLFSSQDVSIVLDTGTKLETRAWCQGGYVGGDRDGFKKSKVMLLGCRPSVRDMRLYPLENGGKDSLKLPAPRYLLPHWDWMELLFKPLFPEWTEWYFTYAIKFADPAKDGIQPLGGDAKMCRPFLEQELRLVDPEYIVLFGTWAAQVFFKKTKPGAAMNRMFEYEYTFLDGKKKTFKLVVMPALHEMQTGIDLEFTHRVFKRQASFLKYLMHPDTVPEGHPDVEKKYAYIETKEQLEAEVERIREAAKTDPRRRVIAVDLEWEGEYPEEPGAKILTLQFSSAPDEAAVVIFHSHALDAEEMPEAQKARINGLRAALSKLLTWNGDWRPRVGGHFLRADLPWLQSLGLKTEDKKTKTTYDVLWSYRATREIGDCRKDGGWDTSVMYHAYREKDSYGLKYLVSREFGVPAWDTELSEFIQDYEKLHHCKVKGFGCVPDEILHIYAARDADYTRMLAERLMFGMNGEPPLLDDDGYGNKCWRPYWLAHRAAPGFMEIEMSGLELDVQRYAKLSQLFYDSVEILLQDFREKIQWPDFNPSSSDHKRLLLFGRKHNPDIAHLLPETAKVLNLDPLYDSKEKRAWEELEEDNEDMDGFRPSTDKNVLRLLSAREPLAEQLKDICKLQTMLKGVLSIPEEKWDRYGYHKLFPKGHFQHLREDNRIHSHMSQLMATGRASSSRPNHQNIGKSAEADLKQILGYTDKDGVAKGRYLHLLGEPHYCYPVRTMYKAQKDHVFIESDFTGAELAVMAWISQDPSMMEHVRRNALPESHPDFYDIHSNVAVRAFQLDCEPTKSGLASIGMKHIRNAAKAVVFGIPYGRGAKAIALQCRVEGVDLSEDDARGLIQAYFSMYPRTREYLNRCKNAVRRPGYVSTLFGRYRRFRISELTPEEVVAKMGREFCNAPIQGTVADSVNVAIYNLLRARHEDPSLNFRIVMQIHDALLLEVHKDSAARVYRDLLPAAMVTDNPIRVVSGSSVNEYHFAIESDMSVHWGEELSDAEALSLFGRTVNQLKGVEE